MVKPDWRCDENRRTFRITTQTVDVSRGETENKASREAHYVGLSIHCSGCSSSFTAASLAPHPARRSAAVLRRQASKARVDRATASAGLGRRLSHHGSLPHARRSRSHRDVGMVRGGNGDWTCARSESRTSARGWRLSCFCNFVLPGPDQRIFLVSNFATWLFQNMYPKTLAGLVQCYTLAIPFFRGTFASDLIYTPILFSVPYALSLLEKKAAESRVRS